MSRIYNLLRMSEDEKKEAPSVSNGESCKEMNISEMKRRILEKIEKEKAAEKMKIDLTEPPSANITIISEGEVGEKAYAGKLAEAESENKRLKELLDDATKRSNELAERLKEQEKSASSVDTLRSKVYSTGKEVKERSSRINQLEEAVKVKEQKIKSYGGLIKELEDKLLQLERESDIKVKSAEEEKGDLKRRLSESVNELTLISRKFAAKEDSERSTENAYRASRAANDEAALKIKSLERENSMLAEKMSQLTDDLNAKEKRLEAAEKLNKEIDDVAREASFRLHGIEREKRELEETIMALHLELGAVVKKHDADRVMAQEEISRLRMELETVKNIMREKERDELNLREALSQAVSGLESRDKKIEADLRYYEKLIREINELKQQMRILGSRRDNPAI